MSSSLFAQLDGRVAAVTGSSTGIGRAIALEFARAGADLIIHARSSEAEAEEVAEEIRQMRRRCEVIMADLEDPEQRMRLAEQAWSTWDGIDIWINNAGADVLTGERASWPFDQKVQLLWNVDVQSTVALSRFVGPLMKARGAGVILNMGWDQAAVGMAGDSGEMFSLIKGAIMSFTLSLARSLAPTVRVNCLAPGWIKTEWGQRASEYWQQRACRESLLQRWGTAEDVAQAARYLASPAARFTSGSRP